MSASLIEQSEVQFQHSTWSASHQRLMGGVAAARVREKLPRAARMKMKALLDAQVSRIDIVPRGMRHKWLQAIRDADDATRRVFVEEDKHWREEIAQIILEYNENLARLKGGNRDRNVVECRRAVAAALRNRGWSLPRIGKFMNRDHSSIMHLLNPARYQQRQERKALAKAVGKME